MEKELKILLLEDNYSDAELLEHTLKKAALPYKLLLVESKERYIRELQQFKPDVILSDYSLPSFSSLEALQIARNTNSDIPFILVTGSVSEEFAVDCMKAGVDDYILKNSLVRLPNSIRNITSKTEVKREKEMIESLHSELQQAYKAIEANNKRLTDSLNYAKLIQEAMLPDRGLLSKYFPQSLIIYRPKDIVSGDFYWLAERGGKLFVAVADCTGHGVPGSLMAMIGSSLLNEIVNVKKLTDPKDILVTLNKSVRRTLKQDRNGNQRCDGMDIAFCAIDPQLRKIEFAGANRHLMYCRNHQLELIKGYKMGIGGLHANASVPFETCEFFYEPGHIIYMCTDGYADQFGGTKGKRMMTRNLLRIIEKSSAFEMNEQEQLLNHWLDRWKGDYEQTDDILLMGIRL